MNGSVNPYLVFLDSNFNLFKIASNTFTQNYLETFHNNGFLQIIKKATRVQGQNISSIDHICVKNCNASPISGTIISDLSDHFINFFQLSEEKVSNENKIKVSRNMCTANMTSFRNALEKISWNSVLALNDVNVAFEDFWATFEALYDIYFPLTHSKFNRNIHNINDYMTKGLLISRTNKNLLHKNILKHRVL